MTVTLLELRTKARQRADMESSQYVTPEELTGLINDSIAELHDLLVGSYGNDYYITTLQFQTVANQADYDLPADFYKLKGVDARLTASNWFSLRPFNFNERNRNEDYAWGFLNGPTVRYRMVGDKLRFSPAPDGIIDCRMWYIPLSVRLSADSDTLKDLNAYSEYVVIDAAIKMRVKEELDTVSLDKMKADMRKRIEDMAQNRDAEQPESISDIYAENNDYYYFRS